MLDKARIIVEGLDHPECIAVHPDGSLWAGGEAGQIYRVNIQKGSVEEMCTTGGFNLGIAFAPGGSWMAICDLGNKCVWRLDMTNLKLSRICDRIGDHDLLIPNYAVFNNDESFFLSESGTPRQNKGKIFLVNPDGSAHVWHSGPFDFANGMAKHGDYLYVVSSFLPGVERVRILPDGTAGERQVFCTLPRTVPDGVAFDIHGNLYVSCYSPNHLYRVTPSGAVSCLIDDWDGHTLSNPTNIAFGGTDFDQTILRQPW